MIHSVYWFNDDEGAKIDENQEEQPWATCNPYFRDQLRVGVYFIKFHFCDIFVRFEIFCFQKEEF